MNVVAIERRSVSQTDWFAIAAKLELAHERHVLADAIEDDDRVVDRVAEDRQHGRDGRGRQLAAATASTRRA